MVGLVKSSVGTKLLWVVLILGSHVLTAHSHWVYEGVTTANTTTTSATRIPVNWSPLFGATDPKTLCNNNTGPAKETLIVSAGSEAVFRMAAGNYVYHPGLLRFIWAGCLRFDWPWQTMGTVTLHATIPAGVPSGEYLLRSESTSFAVYRGALQWWVSCAQIEVVNGGDGSPPMVEVPGHIQADDPNLQVDTYSAPVEFRFGGFERLMFRLQISSYFDIVGTRP
ncbi:hypothetical protein DFP72DRAFT_847297 [Ephemerocybe angulata]|uniref:lytic cellulose monooxygenase (C4-dehydrogenating) n=1 Tax=Ephemerocybe angulata TaxID=980116 RepID=A0A8H6M5I9_9AGAR|nr:hypothetical protein DFP72DRAFT_851991 [Tulosesus angulatus]KAF6755540.1 hypothetical protein DFP72DRAFT_847276 [Tulosesus angulatus]KAF6755562.1 hypothetical protein DFP72DRAFT_847297 [Tulosesus angulatus]